MSFMSFFRRFGGDLTKKINKKVEKILNENTYGVSTYKVEMHKDLFYLKLYYEDTAGEVRNTLYRRFYDAFLQYNFKLQGVTEYFDNREICYTYLKGN